MSNISVTGQESYFNEDAKFFKDVYIYGTLYYEFESKTKEIFGDIEINGRATFNGPVVFNDSVEISDVLIVKDLTVTDRFNVLGNSLFSGISTFQGNVTLGDATSDTVTFNSRISSNVLPSTNGTLDLGGTSNKWNNVYATTFNGQFIGNADTATTATYLNTAQSSSDKDDITVRLNSGFWQTSTATTAEGWPTTTNTWQHLISSTHSDGANYYALQLAAPFFSQNLYFRSTNGSGSTAWNEIITTANITTVTFNSGTRLMFAQASAPTGWTRITTDSADNRMLRVVSSGAGGGVGGSASPILNNVVPAHTHSFSTGTVSSDHSHGVGDPGHTHVRREASGNGSGTTPAMRTLWAGQVDSGNTEYLKIAGTGISLGGISANHFHSGTTDNGSSQTNWSPRYIDLILCSKD